MESLTAYVNDIPVIPGSLREIRAGERTSLVRRLELPLFDASNDIRIEVSNGRAIGLGESWAPGVSRSRERRGTLYVLAIGAGRFDDQSIVTLDYAEKDARDLATALEAVGRPLFEHVQIRVLPDGVESPSAREIRDALPFVTGAGPRDTVVLFLAGHGFTSPGGDYFFVPRDASSAEVRNLLNGKGTKADTLVSWNAVFDALRSAAGERLLIVDTCHSADIRGIAQTFSLAKRSAASRFALIAASRGDELSQDLAQQMQGLFTYALLSALRTARVDSDGILSLAGAYRYIVPVVDRLRPIKTISQTPQLVAPRSMSSMILKRAPPPAN